MSTYEVESTTTLPISHKKQKVRQFNNLKLDLFFLSPEQPTQPTRATSSLERAAANTNI